MKAVITVVGKDRVGILACAATICAKHNANIIDVSQTVMEDFFSMVMLTEIDKITCSFETLSGELQGALAEKGLVAHMMHEDIFNAMHRI